MRNEHTPAPWVIGRANEDRQDFTPINAASWGSFAQVVTAIDGRGPSSEGVANAHLIAAAPELLAALEVLLAVTPKRGILGFDGYVEDEQQPIEIMNARAAIAKAKGEVP